jgi:hypothetical protein
VEVTARHSVYYCSGEVSDEMLLDTAYCLLWFLVKRWNASGMGRRCLYELLPQV